MKIGFDPPCHFSEFISPFPKEVSKIVFYDCTVDMLKNAVVLSEARSLPLVAR